MASNSYYNQNQTQYQPPQQYASPPAPQSYGQYNQAPNQGYPPPEGYPPPHQQSNNDPKFTQMVPGYEQNFNPPMDEKQDFQQTFKIEKPKFNDVWAGVLVRPICLMISNFALTVCSSLRLS